MQKIWRSWLLFGFLAAASFAAQAPRKLGDVTVNVDASTIPVRITSDHPELDALAQRAFESHGRYKRVASKPAFDIRFSAAGANQVRVEIARGGAGSPATSEVATGATLRQALLRAADIAVAKTNGVGLRGFFTAQLAFIGERTGRPEIYVSDLFMGEMKQITSDRAQVLTPRWAPDGSRLIFTSYYKNGFPDIYQYDLRSYQKSVFVALKGTNTGARFSPSGQQVAMVLTGEGSSEIYVVGAQRAQVDASARRTRSDRVKASPVWSPDGSQLVFEMEPGPQLYVMSAAGGQPRRLTPTPGYMAEADWSRTSNKIVCTQRVGGQFQIAVINAPGAEAKIVSRATFDGVEPAWLADGRHVIYTARDRSSSVLCILDTETGKSTALTTSFGAARQASVWTPN